MPWWQLQKDVYIMFFIQKEQGTQSHGGILSTLRDVKWCCFPARTVSIKLLYICEYTVYLPFRYLNLLLAGKRPLIALFLGRRKVTFSSFAVTHKRYHLRALFKGPPVKILEKSWLVHNLFVLDWFNYIRQSSIRGFNRFWEQRVLQFFNLTTVYLHSVPKSTATHAT